MEQQKRGHGVPPRSYMVSSSNVARKRLNRTADYLALFFSSYQHRYSGTSCAVAKDTRQRRFLNSGSVRHSKLWLCMMKKYEAWAALPKKFIRPSHFALGMRTKPLRPTQTSGYPASAPPVWRIGENRTGVRDFEKAWRYQEPSLHREEFQRSGGRPQRSPLGSGG